VKAEYASYDPAARDYLNPFVQNVEKVISLQMSEKEKKNAEIKDLKDKLTDLCNEAEKIGIPITKRPTTKAYQETKESAVSSFESYLKTLPTKSDPIPVDTMNKLNSLKSAIQLVLEPDTEPLALPRKMILCYNCF
jgi:hypothetical protein